MDTQKQQASERIKQANNILVTVSNNPSVDQLAALVGLTVSLNKMGKHATAVFSGNVPSTLEFLQPEKTIEKNTDSLRDFIIALDKSKADKLRYKVEDRVVKIFITPYRTSISDKDLEFSQGDFNVDVVLAMGVHNQADLDQAITSHGRILHDASIITLNVKPGGELGSINWLEPSASSLSEIAVQLVNALDKNLIDTQVSTAFLTGIVAETERFSNGKTTPQTMSISAQLMSSGANQQLVATKLEEPVSPPPTAAAPIAIQAPDAQATPQPVKKTNDGTLEIAHDETKRPEEEAAQPPKEPEETPAVPPATEEIPMPVPPPPAPQIRIDEHGSMSPVEKDEDILPPLVRTKTPEISHHNEAPKMIEPPVTSGALLADDGDSEDKASGLPDMPVKEDDRLADTNENEPSVGPTILPPPEEEEKNAPGTSFLGDQPLVDTTPSASGSPDPAGKTLTDLEREVGSSHLSPDTTPPAVPAEEPVRDVQPSSTSGTIDSEIKAAEEDPIVSAFNNPNGAILPPVAADVPGVPVTMPAPTNEDPSSIPNMPVPSDTATQPPVAPTLDTARDAVAQAMAGQNPLEPTQALNAQPVDLQLGAPAAAVPTSPDNTQSDYVIPPMPVYSQQTADGGIQLPTVNSASTPPNNPPPMMPPPVPPAMQ
jgi:hypothetical protein